MYICICKGVTDRQLASAIHHGKCTRKQLFECFGVGGECGKCNKEIRQLIKHRTAANQPSAENDSIAPAFVS